MNRVYYWGLPPMIEFYENFKSIGIRPSTHYDIWAQCRKIVIPIRDRIISNLRNKYER